MNKEMFGRALAVVSLIGITIIAAECRASVFEERYGNMWRAPALKTDPETIKLASLRLRDLVKDTIDTQKVNERSVEAFCSYTSSHLDQRDITETTLRQQLFPNFTILKANNWTKSFWPADYELLNRLYSALVDAFCTK